MRYFDYLLRALRALQCAFIRDHKNGRALVISNFVRGEFIRGYVKGLIELYMAIREEDSVEDGIEWYRELAGRTPRRVADALGLTIQWFNGLEDNSDVETTLVRLGNLIRDSIFRLDEEFPNRLKDSLACDFGILDFPSEPFSEEQVLDFYSRLVEIPKSPDCAQCKFRQTQSQAINDASINIDELLENVPKGPVKTQLTNIKRGPRSKLEIPSCYYCMRLGDTLIAVQCPKSWVLMTGDKGTFPTICAYLGKQVLLVPSIRDLRAAAKPGGS